MSTKPLDFSKIPARPPPPGGRSNFVDPPTKAGELNIALATLIILSTVCVSLRVYTRSILLVRSLDIGDYLLFIGYGFAVANSAVTIHQTTLGLGRHGWDLPMSTMFPHIMKSTYWGILLYILSLGFTKTTILCIYPPISPSLAFRRCVWVLAGIVVCWTVTALVWAIFYCNPISDFWNLEAALANRCPAKVSFLIYTGAFNVATDLAILVLPILMLRHVTLPIKKKFGVAIVLATGSFVSVVSVVRMVISIRSLTGYDEYEAIYVLLWSFYSFFGKILGGNTIESRSGYHHRTIKQGMTQEADGSIKLRKLNVEKAISPYHEDTELVGKSPMNQLNCSEEVISSADATPAEPHGAF